jgi:hypothetical protein
VNHFVNWSVSIAAGRICGRAESGSTKDMRIMNRSRLMLEANQGNAGRLALAAAETAALPVCAGGANVGEGLVALLPQLARLAIVGGAIAGWQGEPQPLRT